MAEEKSKIIVEISHKTVIFTIALLAGLWFLIQIKEIIIVVFLSLLLLAALLKPVEWLTTKKIPRLVSVLLVYILVIGLISSAISIIIPPLVSQSTGLISKLPQIASIINDFLIFHDIPVENISAVIGQQIQNVAGDIITLSTKIFTSLFLTLTILVMTFYMLLDWKKFLKFISSPFAGKQEKKITNFVENVQTGLGKWVRGQVALSLIVGVLTYIGLRILGIPFALPLALVAGILEIVPIIGPIISAIPAILVGLTITPIMALAVGALFLIIQQLENNLIVPMVMSKVIGLQPPIIMVALLIGAKIAGVGGAFLAIPFVIVLKIALREIVDEDEQIEDDLTEQ
ncbi:hypothetical protein A3A49_02945 [Candidatus Curtissbacteria bacterium RIFCSPLOWO2_01_FULL_38_11b]|uniref:AI-2E family transporter n=1 Tax=Candidatus Curtissbacteria bacterium RIFCSPLOWO2_01_FULL_38_11b TaxID=1797725 RepID=A0A1F5H071_9BACT|nr:MAG: hypothetical protein A3A49_02945 [Candidatus Curtissbacteria bacterium RIFCSPLOWO2_01_FULL_38_11b]